MNPSNNEFSKINLPVLTITGHYDAEQAGAMEFYHRHMANAPLEERAKHYLIIGPWNHAGTRTPDKEVGVLTFGNASMVELKKLHVEWYDWLMKEGKRPEFLKKRVAYYVVGEEKWKYADALESISKETKTLYLHSDGGHANDAFQSGSLSETVPGKSDPDSYVYGRQDEGRSTSRSPTRRRGMRSAGTRRSSPSTLPANKGQAPFPGQRAGGSPAAFPQP